MEFEQCVEIGETSIYGNIEDIFKSSNINNTDRVIPYLFGDEIIADKSITVENLTVTNLKTELLLCIDKLQLLQNTSLEIANEIHFNADKFNYLVNVSSNIQQQIDALKSILQSFYPVSAGTVILSAATSTPPSYLPCDGRLVNRQEYPDLYNAIGVVYTVTIAGYADNGMISTTVPNEDAYPKTYAPTGFYFAIPDFRGLMSCGTVASSSFQSYFLKYNDNTTSAYIPTTAYLGYPKEETMKYHSHGFWTFPENYPNLNTNGIFSGTLPLEIPFPIIPSKNINSKQVSTITNNNFILNDESLPTLVYLTHYIKI